MIHPDRETFKRLGHDYNIIPIFKTMPADLETPVSLYRKLASPYGESFLLESGELGERARYSFIGSDPFLTVHTLGEQTIVREEGEKVRCMGEDPLSVLEGIFRKFNVYQPEGLAPFWGGAVGYLSYDLIGSWEKISGLRQDSRWPACFFSFPRRVFIYDHRRHLLTAVCLAVLKENGDDADTVYARACRELELLPVNTDAKQEWGSNLFCRIQQTDANCPGQVPAKSESPRHSDGFTRGDFAAAVEQAKEYIRAGDIFQVVLSRRTARASGVHPLNIYRAMRSINPSPYQFYLSFPHFQLVGSSPEMLVRLEQGMAYTKPIAGTRPRGRDRRSDLSLAEELAKDEKERAEHMMLVDLGRNDLGKVCAYGSVEVTKLLQVEYFSHVMHLVSEVRGRLRPEYNFARLLRAAFPAGTVSGAPKIRAMEIIAELEPQPRGPYAGAVGYIGFNGEMDTCITIRTVLVSGGQVLIQAGAGIVADSDPVKEFEETEHKMAGSLRAISLAEEWENDLNHR